MIQNKKVLRKQEHSGQSAYWLSPTVSKGSTIQLSVDNTVQIVSDTNKGWYTVIRRSLVAAALACKNKGKRHTLFKGNEISAHFSISCHCIAQRDQLQFTDSAFSLTGNWLLRTCILLCADAETSLHKGYSLFERTFFCSFWFDDTNCDR